MTELKPEVEILFWCPVEARTGEKLVTDEIPMTALYGICSQLVHQLVCSKVSAKQSQRLASLVSMLPVLGVLVYLLKHSS